MSTTISLLALWSYPLEVLQVSWRSASFSLQALKSEKIQTQGIAGNRLNLNKTFCSEKVLKLPILKIPLPCSHRPSPTASEDLASRALTNSSSWPLGEPSFLNSAIWHSGKRSLKPYWSVCVTPGNCCSSPMPGKELVSITEQMAAVRSPCCTYTFLTRLAWRCLKTESDFVQIMFLCWMMTNSCHNTSAKLLKNQTMWVEN